MIRRHILEALRYVEAVYRSWKPSEDTALVWQDILGHLEPDAVRRGVRAYVARGHEFPPNPGQILQSAKPPAPDPLEAWGEVQRAVRLRSSEPVWSHPYIHRAVNASGGFSFLVRNLGDTTRTSVRARFLDCFANLSVHDATTNAYELAMKAADRLELTSQLGGSQPTRFTRIVKEVPARAERGRE